MHLKSFFRLMLVVSGLVLVSGCSTTSSQENADQAEVTLRDQDILDEKKWLESLGVKLTNGNPLKKQPYSGIDSKRSYISPSSWYRDWVKKVKSNEVAPQSQILRQDFVRDLDYLETAFQEVYGGWTFLEQKGFKWKPFFETWRKSLPQSQTISFEEAFASWLQFRRMYIDNHTGPVFGGLLRKLSGTNGSSTYILSEPSTEECLSVITTSDVTIDLNSKEPSHQLRRAYNSKLELTTYISFPTSWGVGKLLLCKSKTVKIIPLDQNSKLEKQIENFTGEKASIPAVKEMGVNSIYVRVPTLIKTNYVYYEKLLKKHRNTNFEGKRVIFDLRNNEGGDGESVIEFLSLFVPMKQALKSAKMKRLIVNSCLATALKFGYTQFTAAFVTPPPPESLSKMIQSSYDTLFPDGNCNRIESWEAGAFSFKDRPIYNLKKRKAKLIILVNRGTGSDAEWLAYMLRSLNSSILVGENTYGVAQFVQPSYFSLPHTKIPFRIARGMSDLYGDERSFDGFGLDVDVLLDTKEQDILTLQKIIDRI